MATIEGEKTVIVDRDRADRTAPVGLIVLLVLAVLAILFFMFGGLNMFNGSTSNGGASTGTQIETPSPSSTDTAQ